MSAVVYHCGEASRRALVATKGPPGLTGIDWIEVVSTPALMLVVHLVKPVTLAAGDVGAAIVALSGGERLPPPQIKDVQAEPSLAACARLAVTFVGSPETDFSTYSLTLVTGPGQPQPPSFIDPRLASIDFSFKVDCPTDFDCRAPCPPGDAAPGGPVLDYTARDYDQLRQLMLDRMAALVPDFGPNLPADFTTTLVEALAYDADQTSYRLDWVGTEAFLATARSRASLRRHARLVDYAIGEGASARTIVSAAFTPGPTTPDGMVLPRHTPLLLRRPDLPPVISATRFRALVAGAPIVFETTADLTLWAWRNRIDFYAWGEDRCVLCEGATAATLIDASGGVGALVPGDLLLLAETRLPATGCDKDARRDRRQVVRLTAVRPVKDPLDPGVALVDVAWAAEDALRFDLAIQVPDPEGTMASPFIAGAAACANLVAADHGLSLPPAEALGYTDPDREALRPLLDPPGPIDGDRWSPQLVLPGTLDLPLARIAPPPTTGPAAAVLRADPGAVLPALALNDDFARWRPVADLLASGPYDRDFVVETGADGAPQLRFGDDIDGLAPASGAALAVAGRFGTGSAANLGADAIAHVVVADAQASTALAVTNPLPATGGADPESAASIRVRAPEAFRRQERAITADDYAGFARGLPEVADALCIPRWTGAWWTMLVYVDRVDGLALDRGFAARVAAGLERYRMMGVDVAVTPAQPVPLDIEILVCVAADRIAADVALAVRKVLSPSYGGAAAFFHPNQFRFRTALQLSQLLAAVLAVPGVLAADVTRFQRWARAAMNELALGVIRPTGPEILRLADDPSRPELGRLVLRTGGGR